MRTKEKTKFALHVERLVRDYPRRFPTRRSIAETIGMSESAFSRAQDDGKSLTVEQCLRLAIALRTNFAGVLRLVGRAKLADSIHLAFAPIPDLHLDGPEKEHLTKWRLLTSDEHHAITIVMDSLVAARAARSSTRGATKHLAKKLKADERAVASAAQASSAPTT